jgi:DNA polymerase-4
MMDRRIACFTVPSFEIELARLNDRGLRNWPTAVAPGNSSRATLLEVSLEARQEGVDSGMRLWQALQICPALRVIATDTHRLFLGQKLLQENIKCFSPVYELANQGEFYLDLTGTGRLFGDAATTALRIKNRILRLGIQGAMGLAANKLVSNVAAKFLEPQSIYDVKPGNEKSFLSPLPVNCLPGLSRLFGPKSKEALTRLEELCLKLNGDVAEVATHELELVFGSKAQLLKQWSVGIDPSPVWRDSAMPLFEIFHTLGKDEIDDAILLNICYQLLERLCSNMRTQNRWLKEITLVLQYSDGREIRTRNKFVTASRAESTIYPALQNLFLSVNRRVRIRRIGLIGHPSKIELAQIELFDRDSLNRAESLSAALDSIRDRYGDELILRRDNKSLH